MSHSFGASGRECIAGGRLFAEASLTTAARVGTAAHRRVPASPAQRRSSRARRRRRTMTPARRSGGGPAARARSPPPRRHRRGRANRSEEHTSELQSRLHLVCRLLLEKKKKHTQHHTTIETHGVSLPSGID